MLLDVCGNENVHWFHTLEPGLLYQDTKSIRLYSLLIQQVCILDSVYVSHAEIGIISLEFSVR